MEIKVHNETQYLNALERLFQLRYTKNYLESWEQQLVLQQLMLTIVKEKNQAKESISVHEAVDKAISYLETRYTEDIKLENLARSVGISYSNFLTGFKKRTGRRPVDYLTNLRVERAKEKLAVSTSRIKTVARQVGYKDELYFSRIFKKVTGVSPTIYASSSRKKIVTFLPQYNDYLVLLGLHPVATTSYAGHDHVHGHLPYLAGELSGIKFVGYENQPKLHMVAKVRPDMIIAPEWSQEMSECAKKIAPVFSGC
ncbi:MAG: AraC family transcriptional regulator [Bacillota bacterium]|nr:AraC family transcriptional regulator [Bacillota bacterium]MDW7683508.1 AraC family transcriptional regulator [Bacillota bacterium]